MPTLIRLVIVLLFLAGLAYGGMIGLIAYVQPTPKEVTVRISTTDLLRASAPDSGPTTPLPSP
ncbi:histidine kinase [Devosia algicola]|uniref:Histidine kinase n=1 Tax=Devosia algicola TaxID=3026418 RepID=A0ABY7YJI0_9HYPH|nr:histidine kinase [Devosia algicola]WDR01402.1 histidine kinase [Devosia algicola]